jgi:hypothetical protein
MALQATVTQFQKAGARGMIANAEARNLISRSLVASAFVLGLGEPVYRVPAGGTGDEQCSADAAAGEFLGLSRRTGVLDPANTPVDTFAANDEVPVMESGVMWVETADAVVAGAVANFNTGTRLWTDAAVAGAIIDVPNVEFDSSTTGAGLAKVRVKKAVA